MKVGFATRLDDIYVSFHHHVLRSSELLDLRAAGGVVPMSVADQKNFDVVEAKAQLLDAALNQRDRTLQAAVNENAAF